MLFSELYSAYYKAVAEILKEALSSNLTDKKISRIAKEHAFGESFLTIEKSMKNGAWPLLNRDNTALIRNTPKMPLTVLQKRWLKAIAQDPRIRLFDIKLPDFPEVEPLFRPEDICIFDKYADGDDYTDENYISHFRLILDSIKKSYPLIFNITNRKGQISFLTAQPEYLEYSEKDDKFRVVTSGCREGNIINIGRIISCRPSDIPLTSNCYKEHKRNGKVVLNVTDERNALERVLLHFAHFAKEAERIDDSHYRVTIAYDMDDETEILIRVLSFGPFVKVIEPISFINQITGRLKMQKSCGLS